MKKPKVQKAIQIQPGVPVHNLPKQAMDPGGLRLTLGANASVKLVSITFGDPFAVEPLFMTFTPQDAREFAVQLAKYADVADGVTSPVPPGKRTRAES